MRYQPFALLVLSLFLALATVAIARPPVAREKVDKTENPEATRLFAEARAARAVWENFPGFTADLVVNLDGKLYQGKVEAEARGKVTVHLQDETAASWVRRSLGSIVGHRLAGAESQTPCFFPDDVVDHPLGRAVQVVDDEFHSSYRVRDRQLIVVNRTMKDIRMSIVVLENQVNPERQFLTAHFVVNSWDRKTDKLVSSAAHHQTWQRIGRFDLPATLLVTDAADGKMVSRQFKLSNVRLTAAGQRGNSPR